MKPDKKIEWSPAHWLTVKEMADTYNRHTTTIKRWCKDGTFSAFGFSVLQLGPRRRYIRRPSA